MQMKYHNWIVFVLLLLMCGDIIQCQLLDNSDFSNYNSNMNFDINTYNNMNICDDVDEGAVQYPDNSDNFYSILKNTMPHSIITSYMDSSLAPEATGDCIEQDKNTPDTKNVSQPTESVTEKCIDGDTTATSMTPASPTTEECKTDSTEKKAPLKLLMKTLMPSGSSTTATPDSSTATIPTSTEASPTEVTTPTTTSTTSSSYSTVTTLETPVTNITSSNAKGRVDSLPISSSSTFSAGIDAESKAKELHQLVQHLYIAQARVQLEATEIRKAQTVANTAQQHLEEAANQVRSIIAALQSAQQEVASAAIRAQTAQLQLAAHDQLLFAARQDVDALSSQMVGLQAAEGFIQPKTTFDVTALLERLKKPLTNAERPTAVPPIVAMPKIKTKRLAKKNSLLEYGLDPPYYD